MVRKSCLRGRREFNTDASKYAGRETKTLDALSESSDQQSLKNALLEILHIAHNEQK